MYEIGNVATPQRSPLSSPKHSAKLVHGKRGGFPKGLDRGVESRALPYILIFECLGLHTGERWGVVCGIGELFLRGIRTSWCPHEDDALFNPPQTECSRLTPCPLPFLHSGFALLARIGVYRLFIEIGNRKSEIGNDELGGGGMGGGIFRI